jgi:hypothetical protein
MQEFIRADITLHQVELAECTLALIEGRVENNEPGWDQASWIRSRLDSYLNPGDLIEDITGAPLIEYNICGMYACFGGWACALSGYIVATDWDHKATVFEKKVDAHGRTVVGEDMGDVEEVAQRLLGVTPWNGDGAPEHLFSGGNDLNDIRRFVGAMRATYEASV